MDNLSKHYISTLMTRVWHTLSGVIQAGIREEEDFSVAQNHKYVTWNLLIIWLFIFKHNFELG